MAAAELEPKSPSVPFFFKGGNFLGRVLTPLWKRGRGDFQAE
jgi:hypothetical protein